MNSPSPANLRPTLAADGGEPAFQSGLKPDAWPALTTNTRAAVQAYLAAGRPISVADGRGVIGDLERALGEWLGLPYVLTTNSGTNAIFSALYALKLPPGSEVIAPVLGFHASITPALHARLTPVLVDVEPDTGNISLDAIRAAVTPRTRCVVVNHNWGHPCEIAAIAEFCRSIGLRLVEDCSHAYGSRYAGELVGVFGDVAVFSMQANKMLPAGEGGFLATRDREIYEAAILLGHYRGRSHHEITDPDLAVFAETGFGLKFRLHPLAACVALAELELLMQRIAERRANAERLSAGLRGLMSIEPPIIRPRVEMGCYFGYRPRFLPGALQRDGREVSVDEFVALLRAEGATASRPSVRPLDVEPIMLQPERLPPAAHDTWRPRLAGPFDGCNAYNKNRLSLPVLTASGQQPLVDDYIRAFTKIEHALARPGPVALELT